MFAYLLVVPAGLEFIVVAKRRYNLGPNGGILTALNLFTTKFDQVLELIEKRADTVEYVVLILHSFRVRD
jgi:hypothetical protein